MISIIINGIPFSHSAQQSELMQYHTIENRDDFYSFDNMSNIRVWDDMGKLIMYDIAEEKFDKLNERLLTIGTYFMEKDVLESQRDKVHK